MTRLNRICRSHNIRFTEEQSVKVPRTNLTLQMYHMETTCPSVKEKPEIREQADEEAAPDLITQNK